MLFVKYFYNVFFILTIFFFSFFSSNSYSANIQEAIKSSKENNKNVKYFQFKEKAAESERFRAVSEFLPNISLNANYGNKNNKTSTDVKDISNKERYEEVRAEQSIFNGFGSVMRYRELDYKFKSSGELKKEKSQEIALRAVESYCDLFLYKENEKHYLENRDLALKMLELAENRKKLRLLNNSDFIEINYESIRAQQEYQNLVVKLENAGYEYENITSIDAKIKLEEPEIKELNIDEEVLYSQIISKNNSVKSSKFSYLSAKYSHDAAKSDLAPKVSVVASASKQRNVVYLNQADLDSRSIYLNVSVPIFQGGKEYSNISAKRHERMAAKEEYEIMLLELKKESSQALSDYRFYQKLYQSNQELEKLAFENLKIIARKSKSKIGNKIDYFRSAIEYNNYRIKTLESKMNLVKSYFKIKYLQSEL